MSELSGRVVIVTGATGGLGGAVSEAFLESGATVVGVSTSWGVKAARKPPFVKVDADLTTEKDAGEVAAAAMQVAGRIDALVHLVGGYTGGTAVADTPAEIWDRMIQVNLRTAHSILRAVLPHMLAAQRGRIVAVGARAGLEPGPSISAYSASKAALHALIRSLAAEVKTSGITANVVLPNVIDTPANRAAMPAADPSRWVKPAAIAKLILWLASDAAADVNGALIPIYGRA
jgi:NAD(P)-dependent dehydrogenase (short-subunit alcohol dehydrogenase family)